LLLPGDIISVKPAPAKPSSAVATNGAAQAQGSTPPEKPKADLTLDENTGIAPCDCVLLHGDGVVNEATLTGESVPQMKDALPSVKGADDTPLDIDGLHRVHVVFSGTTIIACNGPREGSGDKRPKDSDPSSVQMEVLSAMCCGPASVLRKER
jgi:hypothetical protein